MNFEEDMSIAQHIEYFLDEFFPEIHEDEAALIQMALKWPDKKKAAFHIAKSIFEEDSSKS